MASTDATAPGAPEEILGHRFADPDLLAQALTHTSLAGDGGMTPTSYERLEFLGDRVLGLVMAEWLVQRFAEESEGALARRFAALVQRDACARVARAIAIGPHIRLTQGEEGAGGRDKDSVLADVCEALIGALYLDGGLEPVRRFIRTHWAPLVAQDLSPPREPKTALQEWAQGRGLTLPHYRLVARSGPDHAPLFTVTVEVAQSGTATADGGTKREAERAAARALLDRLEEAS